MSFLEELKQNGLIEKNIIKRHKSEKFSYSDFSISQNSVESAIHGLDGSGGVINGSNSLYCS
jgi:hypothetical protein